MKVGVILYHSNIKNLYKERWIKKSIGSMINQSFNNLTFYEVDYSDSNQSILEEYPIDKKFWSVKLDNYSYAMNFILEKAFCDGCDYVFNTNLDDYYHPDRVKLQLEKIEKFDILSTDFVYIEEEEDADKIIREMGISEYSDRINSELKINHNVIAHPSVCYNKNIWKNEEKYDPIKIPEEDLDLWKRLSEKNYRIGILPEVLLFYRIHNKQISKRRKENVY
jgi:hypothetical protein